MKKIIALLLILFIIPTFSITSFAYHAFSVAEKDYRACFVYAVDGKAFFSSDKTILELSQTGKTTIVLPAECEGKNIYLRRLSNATGGLSFESKLPCVGEFYYGDLNGGDKYIVDFVCSKNAQYDYERQIGHSESLHYVGYSLNNTRIMFLSQNEIDTALRNGEVYVEDTYLRENPLYNVDTDKYSCIFDNTISFSGKFDDSDFVYEIQCRDGTKYDIYIINDDTFTYKMQHCSCKCHKDGFIGFMWNIINFFNKIFKSNKTCSCGISHY